MKAERRDQLQGRLCTKGWVPAPGHPAYRGHSQATLLRSRKPPETDWIGRGKAPSFLLLHIGDYGGEALHLESE